MLTNHSHFRKILLFMLGLFLLAGCGREQPTATSVKKSNIPGCRNCHSIILDKPHDLDCSNCHNGKSNSSNKELAHAGLITQPAHPTNMAKVCGPCHAETVKQASESLHFTLKNKTNLVRRAFGASADISSLTDIPVEVNGPSALGLVDDLLRRRCLRCHVFSTGDAYPETSRGTGCAACHLSFAEGKMQDHTFLRLPPDEQCLHCHYGNRVGADYLGRFEQDLNQEYRTPFVNHPRLYGVESHPLSPDIHAVAGLSCIDCHSGIELMGKKSETAIRRTTCLTCHDYETAKLSSLSNIEVRNNQIMVKARLSGRKLLAPLLSHEAHTIYAGKADCVVCHAQWVFLDQGTHLLRLDSNDDDKWEHLAIQGSSAVEMALGEIIYEEAPEELSMADGISGGMRPGIWLKSYLQRRWEFPLVGEDKNGRLHLYRPILDLTLSHLNSEGEIIFDGLKTVNPGDRLLPYTPHTIGRAGIFFKHRLTPKLQSNHENISEPSTL